MKRIFYILSFSAIILFSSCRGDDQNKLVGVWEYISHYEPDSVKVYFQFYAGDALEIYKTSNSQPAGDTLKLTYSIASSTFNIYNGLSESSGSIPGLHDPRGEYWVEVLKDDEFKATKQKDLNENSAYLRLEMIKR